MIHPSSFRDQNGFVFPENEEVFRQVSKVGSKDFEILKETALYALRVKRVLPVDVVKISKMIDQRVGFMRKYSKEEFNSIFIGHFSIIREALVENSSRAHFLLKRKD